MITKDLNPGKVWWFYCLHEDKAEPENPEKKGETQIQFVVEGKKRPCLIFGYKNNYCNVWKMTGSRETKHRVEVRTYKGPKICYLRETAYPNSRIPIHEKLIDVYFGYVDTAELTRLSKEYLSEESYLPPS